jgi:hypothetical protein
MKRKYTKRKNTCKRKYTRRQTRRQTRKRSKRKQYGGMEGVKKNMNSDEKILMKAIELSKLSQKKEAERLKKENELLAKAIADSLQGKKTLKESISSDEMLSLAIAKSLQCKKSPKKQMTEDEMLALAFANSLELSPKFNALQQGDIYTNPCHEGYPWDNQKFKFIQIPGDGHCGYYSVLGGVNPDVYLRGDQYIQPSLHEIKGLRDYIAKKIPKEKLEIAAAADNCSPSEYKRRVKKDKYMDEIELEQLANHFEVPIVVHDTGSGRTLVHGKRFLRIKPPIHLHYDSPDEGRNLAHYSLLLPR